MVVRFVRVVPLRDLEIGDRGPTWGQEDRVAIYLRYFVFRSKLSPVNRVLSEQAYILVTSCDLALTL